MDRITSFPWDFVLTGKMLGTLSHWKHSMTERNSPPLRNVRNSQQCHCHLGYLRVKIKMSCLTSLQFCLVADSSPPCTPTMAFDSSRLELNCTFLRRKDVSLDLGAKMSSKSFSFFSLLTSHKEIYTCTI